MECSSFWVGLFVSLFIFPYPYVFTGGLFYDIIGSICGGISTYITVKIILNLKLLES
jgi:hypothetical protein